MYSKNLQDGVGTSPGATNSWKKKRFKLHMPYFGKYSHLILIHLRRIYPFHGSPKSVFRHGAI